MKNAVKVIRGYLEQVSTDIYNEISIDMGPLLKNNKGILIKRVEVYVRKLVNWTDAQDQSLSVDVSYGFEPSYEISDPRNITVLGIDVRSVALSTTTFLFEKMLVWDAPPGFIVLTDRLWLTLGSVNTGQSNTANVRVFYTEQQFTELEVIQLLAIQNAQQ